MVQEERQESGQAEPGDELVVVATYLPLRNFWDIIPFMRMSRRVEEQLKEAHGLIRYGLRAKLLRQRFWTCSVWADRASVDSFVSAEPHASAMQRFKKWSGKDVAFVEWRTRDDAIDWTDALERLKNPINQYGGA
ncbi:MAG: hypothetical protein V3U79_10425 [Dehalococcoidia bacterium]